VNEPAGRSNSRTQKKRRSNVRANFGEEVRLGQAREYDSH